MTNYRFTPQAKRQLIGIWDYSVSRWGQRRAERYLRAINTTVALVAAKKRQARTCEHYGPNLSFIRSGSHNIYYDTMQQRICIGSSVCSISAWIRRGI